MTKTQTKTLNSPMSLDKHLIMTPGPTEIHPNVLEAMATKGTNPDLDPDFFHAYQGVLDLYNQVVGTKNGTSLILAGEAILGLEAACASFIKPGDTVLCIANGFFGAGFEGFITMYGGIPLVLELPWERGIDLESVKAMVEMNPQIKLATMVHCETPTGITNDLAPICQYLQSRSILSIVDSVSAVGGELVDFDTSGIDVLLGGSQKCLSAPSGLTLVTMSERAVAFLEGRTEAIPGYYLNLKQWLGWYDRQWFPYTQPLQNIMGLKQAIENNLAKEALKESADFARKVRNTMTVNGLKLFGSSELSNTVTAVYMPEEIEFPKLFSYLKDEHHILIGGSLGHLKGRVFRLGHMGENNKEENFLKLFKAMDDAFRVLGNIESLFEETYKAQ